MTARTKVATLWLALGGAAVALALVTAGPLRVGWQCYWLHTSGAGGQAEVVAKLENTTFALMLQSGEHAGQACTASTSRAIYDATELGASLDVLYLDWKPGECELGSTIEASSALLWLVTSAIAIALLSLLLIGLVITRSLLQPSFPARRFEFDPAEARCPGCGKAMDEGYLVVLAGVHWRKAGEPIGLPHALSGLPGTVGWRGRPRLHAVRCVPCEITTLQYGDPASR